MNTIRSYQDLIVWQRSTELAISIYKLTSQFSNEEKFGLTSQMRRAVISVSSNIAEGRSRGGKKDFCHFLRYAYASASELESQMYIAKKLFEAMQLDFKESEHLLDETMRMLNSMIKSLSSKL